MIRIFILVSVHRRFVGNSRLIALHSVPVCQLSEQSSLVATNYS